MALSASRVSEIALSTLLADSRAGFSSPMSPAQQDMVRALCEAICGAVLQEIIAYGTVTVTVASVSGVTTGPGVSGPGTGTGTIS
jgi:hypothetical protein